MLLAGGQGLKKLWCSFGDKIYIQKKVGRKRDGAGTTSAQTIMTDIKSMNCSPWPGLPGLVLWSECWTGVRVPPEQKKTLSWRWHRKVYNEK